MRFSIVDSSPIYIVRRIQFRIYKFFETEEKLNGKCRNNIWRFFCFFFFFGSIRLFNAVQCSVAELMASRLIDDPFLFIIFTLRYFTYVFIRISVCPFHTGKNKIFFFRKIDFNEYAKTKRKVITRNNIVIQENLYSFLYVHGAATISTFAFHCSK